MLGNPNIEKRILDNINSVMNLCRNCNVLLRWYLLHTSKVHLRNYKLIFTLIIVYQTNN